MIRIRENNTYTGVINNATLLGTLHNYDLQFGTNDNVRMTILRGGNIGIGITDPACKLDVKVDDGTEIGVRIDYDATQNYALLVDSEAVYAGILVQCHSGLEIDQNVGKGGGSGGYGAYIHRNINETGDNPLVRFSDLHATNTQTTLEVKQVGTGDILNLFDDSTEVFTVLDGGQGRHWQFCPQ